MNRTAIHDALQEAIRDANASTATLDFWINDSIRPFLRELIARKAWSHFAYIPRVTLTLTDSTYSYTFKDISKRTDTTGSWSSGVYTPATATTYWDTYYIVAGDILTENATTNYNIIRASTTLRVDSTAPSSANIIVYPGIFEVVSARTKDSGATYYITLGRSKREFELEDYTLSASGGNRLYRIEGDRIWLNWLPSAGTIDLKYIPFPLTFSSTLTDTNVPNPTNLTDEMDRALVWFAAERYYRNLGNDAEAKRSEYSKFECLNAIEHTGSVAWDSK